MRFYLFVINLLIYQTIVNGVNYDSPPSFNLIQYLQRLQKSIKVPNNSYLNNNRRMDQDYYNFHSAAEENKGDVHIHLNHLVDTHFLDYLIKEVPWNDILNKPLPSMRDEKTQEMISSEEYYIDPELVSSTERNFLNKEKSEETYLDVEDADEAKILLHQKKPYSKNLIRFKDCPFYFAETFGASGSSLVWTTVNHRDKCLNERRKRMKSALDQNHTDIIEENQSEPQFNDDKIIVEHQRIRPINKFNNTPRIPKRKRPNRRRNHFRKRNNFFFFK